MSAALICDVCGSVIKEYGLRCAELVLRSGKRVCGADICKKCMNWFDFRSGDYGWLATPNSLNPNGANMEGDLK